MICTGDTCAKRYECGRCVLNLNPTFSGVHTVETLATFGTATLGTATANSNDCNTEFVCGCNGNYRLYVQKQEVQK